MSQNKAVFFDRDGTLIESINDEPPRLPSEVKFKEGAIECLRQLSKAGFMLFLISNQPDLAKKKASQDSLLKVHNQFNKLLVNSGIFFERYNYCYHHPEGLDPLYSYVCKCRKPSPYFILISKEDSHIDLNRSWMVGDRNVDIECGKRAGVRTILLTDKKSVRGRKSKLNHKVSSLKDVASLILKR